MPVIPKGIPPFSIKAPLTSQYTDGAPTESILQDAKRVFDFIEDERHLTAYELYKSVKNRIETWDRAHKQKHQRPGHGKRTFFGGKSKKTQPNANTTPEDQEYSNAKAFLQARNAQIVKLEVRKQHLFLQTRSLQKHLTSLIFVNGSAESLSNFQTSLAQSQ